MAKMSVEQKIEHSINVAKSEIGNKYNKLTIIGVDEDKIRYVNEMGKPNKPYVICRYDGEMKIHNDEDKLHWVCPNCSNTDEDKLYVARRTCGYIGVNKWNQGRTSEINERVLHL